METIINTTQLQSRIEMLQISQRYMDNEWFEMRFLNLKIIGMFNPSIN